MSRNQAITTSPIVLFVGAGASAALGKPMMAEFLSKTSTNLDPSLTQLLSCIRHFRGSDLEAILNDVENIIDLSYLQSCSVQYVPAYPQTGIPGSEEAPPSLVIDRVRRETALLLKEALEREIISEYSSVDETVSKSLYEPVLELLFRSFRRDVRCLPIFSTNYDPAIERFYETSSDKYSLTDGFRHHLASRSYYWDSSTYDNFTLEEDRRNLVLFKLHGSSNWIRRKVDNQILYSISIHDSADRTRYENVIIYPAARKVTIKDPYFTAYDYFQRCCERAKVCLVIGYSFRDYDLLTRLMSALRFNDSLCVAVLDPRAEELKSEFTVRGGRFVPLAYRFGNSEDENDYLRAIRQVLPWFPSP